MRKWVILLGAALALRLLLWAWFAGIPVATFDEHEFNELAVNLAARGEFGLKPGEPTSVRPPLYAGFVALVYSAFGMENVQAVRLVQIFMNLLTAVVLYGIAVRLFDERTGFWAAALCAFYPSLLGHDFLLLTEVLFTFLLSVGAYFAVRFFKENRLSWAGLSGVVLGLGALTRSVLWVFPPWFLLLSVLDRRRRWRERLAGAGVFLLAFAATLAPWAVRNTRLQGTLTIVDSRGGQIVRWAWGSNEPSNSATPAPGSHLSEGERDRRAMQDAVRSFWEKPLLVLQRVWYHTRGFWGLERELVSGAKRGHFGELSQPCVVVLGLIIGGYYAALMLTAITGVLTVRPAERPGSLFVLALAAHIFVIHALVFGHSRYHIPVVALLTVYSGAAIAQGRSLLHPELRWRLRLGVVLFALLAASWAYSFLTFDSKVLFGS